MEDFQHQQMGYDRAAQTFSPDGHILQVEYAEKTIRLGSASIGIVCHDGVIIVSDRRKRDSLIIEESANKIQEIDDHIIVVSAGIASDARILVDKARLLAQQHKVTYDTPVSAESIVKDISDDKQKFTQYGGARPFGVSMMFAASDGENVLYTTDVSGNYLKYKANAIGENDTKLRDLLRKEYKAELSTDEAVKLALKIFEEVQGEDFNKNRFDVGIVGEDGIQKMKA